MAPLPLTASPRHCCWPLGARRSARPRAGARAEGGGAVPQAAEARRAQEGGGEEAERTRRALLLAAGAAAAAAPPARALNDINGKPIPGTERAPDIITGYTPAKGYTVTVATHTTPDFDQWLNDVFIPAQNDIAKGDFGSAMASSVRTLACTGENGSLCVVTVVPTEFRKDWEAFYDEKSNPLWKQGRDAGWLTGSLDTLFFTPALYRGARPGPPPPGLSSRVFPNKSRGLLVASLGSAPSSSTDAFISSITSSESDVYHKEAAVINTIAGPVDSGTLAGKGFGVLHVCKSQRDAVKLSANLGSAPYASGSANYASGFRVAEDLIPGATYRAY